MEGVPIGRRLTKLVKYEGDDKVVNVMLDQVDVALRALKAREVGLSSKQMQKQKIEDKDEYSQETKQQLYIIDMEAKSRGLNL